MTTERSEQSSTTSSIPAEIRANETTKRRFEDSGFRVALISLLTFVVCVIVTVAVFSFAASTFKWTEVNATVVEKVYIPPNTVYEAVGRGVDGQLVVTLQKVIRDPAWVLVVVDENSVTWNVHVDRYEWERTKLLDDIKVRQVDNGN